AHNWSGRLTVHAALDGTVQNLGSRMYSLMERKHLSALQNSADRDSLFLVVQTKQSEIHIAEAARIKLKLNDEEFEAAHREIIEPDYVAQELEIDLLAGDSVKVQKLVAVFSSRDFAISEPGLAAREALKKAPDFEKLLGEQIETWRQLWRRFDLSMETDDLNSKMQISLLLHLHSFHVLQTTFSNSIDLDVGVPARGWSEGYQGHVFWDDLFFFPFLNLRMPEVTQSLLKYRYRRLDAARQIALDMGAKGARFPWQSGSDGREETPDVLWYPKANRWVKDYSHLQIHVNAAIAFDVWQYYQVTGNLEFMYAYGAEMIFEIARFFASVARYNAERQRYEIHGVVGPDEYHVAYPDSTQAGI
ncbi:MAG: hypothetical protein K2Z81_25525, partial [Cyanobacteria bacterium]|nr:hypothetical protein [Cyanobacteriota bacterium]